MLLAMVAGCAVSVAIDIAEANGRVVAATEITIRSLTQKIIDAEIAQIISTLVVYTVLPVLVALCVYHVLIRRARRRAQATDTNSSQIGRKAERAAD